MKNFKLVIQYDGGRYKGWQRLGKGENTIQGKIENVLSEMLKLPIEITGSSRTDAGVHAYGQIANFKAKTNMSADEIKTYLNKYLPNDICIRDVRTVAERFHAQHNAKSKTYVYKILNNEQSNPFMRKYSMHIKEQLDLNKMISGAVYFVGEHDFTAFSNAKSKTKSFVREIYKIDIEQKNEIIEISISGNGFLYNMVRKIVGKLIEIGLGTADARDIETIFLSKERDKVNILADSCGLYLLKIEF